MHEAGVLFQHEVRVAEGRIVEMCLGCPRIERFERPDGLPAFAITTSIACWVSRADDPTDPGFSAMATMKTQARLTAAKPAHDGLLRLTLSYEPRPPGEVELHGQMTAEERAFLQGVLEQWTGTRHSDAWTGEMPAAPGKVVALAAEFSSKDDLQVGLGFEGGFSTDGLPSNAAAEQAAEWSLALSRPLLARRVHDAFAAQLGAAPPPFGNSPVVSQSQGVYLDFLELKLADGEVLLTGQISRSGFGGIHASFTVHVSLSLTATGLISPSVGDVEVEVAEWYATVADVLSGGAVTSAVRQGIRYALSSPDSHGQLASMLTPDLVESLAVARTAADVHLRPKIKAVEVKRKGLRLVGTLKTAAPKGPSAELQAVAGAAGNPTLLYGVRSAVPGSNLAEVRWDFGDGVKETLSGAGAALAVGHAYAAGTHKPKITVVDSDGRQASATTTVKVS